MKHVIVTGGTRGIGAGIVKKLTEEGYAVTFCGTKPESEICRCGEPQYADRMNYVRCDVSVKEQREHLLEKAVAKFGPVFALVNNAGVAPLRRADILEAEEESFERLMRINLQGPYFLTQLVAKSMIQNPIPGQCIINMSSCSAETASVSRGEYCISKAGVSMATKLWQVRLAEFGINVYEIRPGVIKSDMTEVVAAKYDKLIADGLTLNPRWGYPEDVAKAAAAFLRGDFSYSTGQVVCVDGGMQIGKL